MTARRIAAEAVRIALGAAALAAVVGAAWVAGSAITGPNAGHAERVVVGVVVAFLMAFLALVAAWAGRAAYDISDAIVDAWRERRR